MAAEEYCTIKGIATGEYEEKKSRFIATVKPVASEEEALEFIAGLKKKYWDARHNCHAFILTDPSGAGAARLIKRSSDDGEPSRTAGVPMLDILEGRKLYGVCAVVTRYFGGVLLGTGGLVRAYQSALSAALDNAEILTAREMNRAAVTTDYTGYGKIQYIAASRNIMIADTEFIDAVRVIFYAGDEELEAFRTAVTEATAAKARFELLGKETVLI